MERLLTEIDIHCFKANQIFSNFIKEIHKVHRFAMGLGISIHEVPEYIEQKKKRITVVAN